MIKILIVADDVIGSVMAGPGLRFVTFADLLSHQATVTMAVPHEPTWHPKTWTIVPYSRYGNEIQDLVEQNDVIICKGLSQFHFPALARSDRVMICDLYDPFMFENLAAHASDADGEATYMYQFNLDLVLDQLRRGDYFICANERQRDLWLGMLTSLGRVNHATYAVDPSLRALIDVVPFGLPSKPPVHLRPVMKGVWSGVASTDRIILWGGGVWNWLDVSTPLRAMAILAKEHPDIKLCFMGKARPADSWYTSADAFDRLDRDVEQLASSLGVLGNNVFFNDHWVPVDQRGAYLLEADAGIISHTLTLETHYSARTRALDYLWAGLPIVTTGGDTVAQWVERFDLGMVVPPSDPQAYANAIVAVLNRPRSTIQAHMEHLISELRWDHTVAPLLAFCAAPKPAADLVGELAQQQQHSLATSVTHRDHVIRDLEAAIHARDVEITDRQAWLAKLEQSIVYRDSVIAARDAELVDRQAWLAKLEQSIVYRNAVIAARDAELAERRAWLAELEQGISYRDVVIATREQEIAAITAVSQELQHIVFKRDEALDHLQLTLDVQEQVIHLLQRRWGWLDSVLTRIMSVLTRAAHRFGLSNIIYRKR
ncbi:MAG: hypothetical protein NVSMB42_04540 [Herpetosiphon sp.]